MCVSVTCVLHTYILYICASSDEITEDTVPDLRDAWECLSEHSLMAHGLNPSVML